jgi:2-succinyl-6-hydroxy-2,4-cyclohexadiene-1-carboxylate synthase
LSGNHRDIDAGDGLRLHVVTSGAGPPNVLLHGFTGSTETWRPLRSDLEGSFQVVAVDLPGHGKSSSPADPSRYSLTRFADDLASVFDHLEIDRTAVLGYSMGGRAALHFGVAHGDRLAALVLESASQGIGEPSLRDERKSQDEELARFIEVRGIEPFVDRWERLSLWESQNNLPPAVRAALRAQRLENNVQGLANSLRGAGAAVDPLDSLEIGKITAPCLILAGALDSKYTQIAHELKAIIANSRVAVIPQAGHAVHLEQPRAFAKTVLQFLDEAALVRDASPRV